MVVRILNSVVRRVQEAGHLLLERLLRGVAEMLRWGMEGRVVGAESGDLAGKGGVRLL